MNKDRGLTGILKDLIRREIHRRGYEILADPFSTRLVRMLNWAGVDTVIDGGANVGQFAESLRASGFAGQIFSVEPLSKAHAVLQTAASEDPRWHVQRGALGASNGTVDINISGNSVSSSILPMLDAHSDADPKSVYVGTESVPVITLDDLIAQHDISPESTLLKLDVQGYEATALAGATQTIGRFAAAQLELSYVPLYEGSWLADQVEDFLGSHGYTLWMLDPAAMHDPRTGRLMQCDGVFVRA